VPENKDQKPCPFKPRANRLDERPTGTKAGAQKKPRPIVRIDHPWLGKNRIWCFISKFWIAISQVENKEGVWGERGYTLASNTGVSSWVVGLVGVPCDGTQSWELCCAHSVDVSGKQKDRLVEPIVRGKENNIRKRQNSEVRNIRRLNITTLLGSEICWRQEKETTLVKLGRAPSRRYIEGPGRRASSRF